MTTFDNRMSNFKKIKIHLPTLTIEDCNFNLNKEGFPVLYFGRSDFDIRVTETFFNKTLKPEVNTK